MKVIIETVSHISQRYNTIGDWQWEGETLHIKVSDMGDWKKELLVGVHEMVETMLCKESGVTEEQVDAFDLSHSEEHEPGENPDAPYYHQHKNAIYIEDMLMQFLGVDADEYETVMEKLQDDRDKAESEREVK